MYGYQGGRKIIWEIEVDTIDTMYEIADFENLLYSAGNST